MAFVLNRIDYCNAVLAGLPRTAIEPLQHAQNAAARLVFGLRSSDHITRALTLLHWLPVRFHIKFKLCLLMHQIHVGRCPSYLAALVSSSADNCRRPGLRSVSSSSYLKPRLRTKLGERAFSFCGSAEWSCLPSELQWSQTPPVFKRNLKHIFITRHSALTITLIVLAISAIYHFSCFYCNALLDFFFRKWGISKF